MEHQKQTLPSDSDELAISDGKIAGCPTIASVRVRHSGKRHAVVEEFSASDWCQVIDIFGDDV